MNRFEWNFVNDHESESIKPSSNNPSIKSLKNTTQTRFLSEDFSFRKSKYEFNQPEYILNTGNIVNFEETKLPSEVSKLPSIKSPSFHSEISMNSTNKSRFKTKTNFYKQPEININVNNVYPNSKVNRHKQSFHDQLEKVDPRFEERSSKVLNDVRFRSDIRNPIDFKPVD